MARYFMLSVSTRDHLEICREYALSGVTNSTLGVWAYVDVKPGDFVSLLYGARAYDLYRVKKKYAVRDAENLGPWPKITFKGSGRSYYFPFRFELEPIRRFEESLVRPEFAYVAENLLLRGGYRKTHFQADQTTLQQASQLGEVYHAAPAKFNYEADNFEPVFVTNRNRSHPPESYLFNEYILQSLLKDYLTDEDALKTIVEIFPELKSRALEVLGEKALQRGHVDILMKEAVPIGLSHNIVIEVKNTAAKIQDLAQLVEYKKELGKECLGAVLIARTLSERIADKARELGIKVAWFDLNWNEFEELTYENLRKLLKVSFINSR